jgi:hypothetical protein
MSEVIANFSNPAWWISVVVFGLVLQIAATYSQRGIDKLLSKIFVSWRNRTERRRKERSEMVQLLQTDKLFYEITKHHELRSLQKAQLWAVLNLFLLIVVVADEQAREPLRLSFSHLHFYLIFFFFSIFSFNFGRNFVKAKNLEYLLDETGVNKY